MKAASFPTLLERFFLQRLIRQRQVSPHTVSSYRDTFRLLLQFAKRRLWFISVIARKLRRSWRHQISSPGTVDGITCFCFWRSKLVYACLS